VNVYVNDEDIRYLAKENTPTKDGDTISIVPSIAGGSPSALVVVVALSSKISLSIHAGNIVIPSLPAAGGRRQAKRSQIPTLSEGTCCSAVAATFRGISRHCFSSDFN